MAILTNLNNINLEIKLILYGVLRFLTGFTSNFYTVAVVLGKLH